MKDSKAFSSRARRAAVAAAIKVEKTFVGQGRGVVTSVDITHRGMAWAIGAAFQRAVKSLPRIPDLVLVDGEMAVPSWPGKQQHRPKADVHWWPVSAASVLAKVERDDWMVKLDQSYPGYGWPANAGYGTPEHWQALRTKGATPVHRLNFLKSGLRKYDVTNEGG